jgi:hypothetical protein
MKSNLLANVSHELQTPLVSIKGYTELILKGRLGAVTDEQRKGLDVSLRNIDRLIGMINNLLNFSRIERDMSSMRIESWPLHQLVEETIDVVREAATELRIAITTRYMTDDLIVKADREKISQVFLNLLSNAIKYNREGGQVEVDVRKGKRGYLIVDVRDTGVGIPKDSLERIFERYRAAGRLGQPAPGSGSARVVRDILRMQTHHQGRQPAGRGASSPSRSRWRPPPRPRPPGRARPPAVGGDAAIPSARADQGSERRAASKRTVAGGGLGESTPARIRIGRSGGGAARPSAEAPPPRGRRRIRPLRRRSARRGPRRRAALSRRAARRGPRRDRAGRRAGSRARGACGRSSRRRRVRPSGTSDRPSPPPLRRRSRRRRRPS